MLNRLVASRLFVAALSTCTWCVTAFPAHAGTPAWHNDANPGPTYPRAVDPNAGQPVAAPANPGSQVRPAGNFTPNGPTAPYTPGSAATNQLPMERKALGEQQTSTTQTPGAYTPGSGPPAAAVPAGPAPPFRLTQEQEQAVDALLQAWELKQVKKFSATFTRWDYDLQFAPKEKDYLFKEASGYVKYQAPDKGQFKVDKLKQLNTSKAKYEVDPMTKISVLTDASKVTYDEVPDALEEWRCNGKSIYEFDHRNKRLIEHKLPPELQGKAIINSPLPFVFGAEAKKIKERYWVRIVTPPGQKSVWLEAVPRFQADAANYDRVEIILSQKDLVPTALQLYQPGGKNRQVYKFEPATEIWNPFAPDFSNPGTPFGWKSVVEDSSQPPSSPEGNRDAKRPPPTNNPTMRK